MKITKAEIDRWGEQQKRAFIAGTLDVEQVALMREVGFPIPKFSATRIGTIIRKNKLSTEAKYTTFRRKHPKLRLPTFMQVRVLHTAAYGEER